MFQSITKSYRDHISKQIKVAEALQDFERSVFMQIMKKTTGITERMTHRHLPAAFNSFVLQKFPNCCSCTKAFNQEVHFYICALETHLAPEWVSAPQHWNVFTRHPITSLFISLSLTGNKSQIWELSGGSTEVDRCTGGFVWYPAGRKQKAWLCHVIDKQKQRWLLQN